MRQLFLFIYNYRAFFVFLLFEGLSAFLIIQNQNYHKAAFINSSNVLVGNVVNARSNVVDYFALRSQNQKLSDEVARLNEQIATYESASLGIEQAQSVSLDSQYQFIPAKVVNNSFRQLNNYLTLNKGLSDGILPDQGVISPDGIVGKVRSVSESFSIVVSLLHTNFLVSSVHNRSGSFCTTNWDGRDANFANLLFVPRHLSISQGDSITTSGYNSIFPPGRLIGVVEEVSTSQNATFHDIRIRLTTPFSQLNYVSVVNHIPKEEKDSLEQKAVIIN